jgi:hypothetical protein
MINLLPVILFFIMFSATVHAQALLYQWAFTNSSDTFSNSAATYTWVSRTGNLTLQNVSSDVSGLNGADGINPMVYFTNSNVGPVIPADGSLGAFVANGQGYSPGFPRLTL